MCVNHTSQQIMLSSMALVLLVTISGFLTQGGFIAIENQICSGNDLLPSVMIADSLDTCQKACLSTFDCTAVVFNKHQGHCWVKSKCKDRKHFSGYVTYLLDPGGYTAYPNKKCTGKYIKVISSYKSVYDCLIECTSTAACEGVVYTERTGKCSLRTYCNVTRSSTNVPGTDSYMRDSAGFSLFTNHDCEGQNFVKPVNTSSHVECWDRCTDLDVCEAMVYNNDSKSCTTKRHCTVVESPGLDTYKHSLGEFQTILHNAYCVAPDLEPPRKCYEHQCKEFCEANKHCSAFVFYHRNSTCYLKEHCDVTQEDIWMHTRTYLRPRATMTKLSKLECKGKIIDTLNTPDVNVCKQRCIDNTHCVAVVFGYYHGDCWLNSRCDSFNQSQGFDSYIIPTGYSANCNFSYGKSCTACKRWYFPVGSCKNKIEKDVINSNSSLSLKISSFNSTAIIVTFEQVNMTGFNINVQQFYFYQVVCKKGTEAYSSLIQHDSKLRERSLTLSGITNDSYTITVAMYRKYDLQGWEEYIGDISSVNITLTKGEIITLNGDIHKISVPEKGEISSNITLIVSLTTTAVFIIAMCILLAMVFINSKKKNKSAIIFQRKNQESPIPKKSYNKSIKNDRPYYNKNSISKHEMQNYNRNFVSKHEMQNIHKNSVSIHGMNNHKVIPHNNVFNTYLELIDTNLCGYESPVSRTDINPDLSGYETPVSRKDIDQNGQVNVSSGYTDDVEAYEIEEEPIYDVITGHIEISF